MLDLLTQSDAAISFCGLYRYRLTLRWGSGPTCTFIMLNPSTADATQDDPTIRRCISFARREDCGALRVINCFALRATKPADLFAADDPIGPENDRHILAASQDADGPIIAAWGAHGSYRDRAMDVMATLSERPWCLGLTAKGQPRHPLYVRGDAPLIRFN